MTRGCLALLLIVTTSISATQSRSTDIPALVLQLGDPKTEWKAASQLQKLGAPAVAVLVQRLRQDGFRDRDHGNHSPTMRALEKIGEPAVPEIDRALTSALLRSADPEDVRFVETAVLTLTAIGGSVAAPSLVRAGVSAGDVRARALAFDGIVAPWFDHSQTRFDRPWESCLRYEARYACPSDAERPRVAEAIRPLLGTVRNSLERESDVHVRLAMAQVLAFWGMDGLKADGEKELLNLAARPDQSYVQEQAIRTLGLLGVDAAREVIKSQRMRAANAAKLASVEALARLHDDGYRSIAEDLVRLQTSNLQPYSQDIYLRGAAIRFAGRSHDLKFVPVLIEVLDDRSWNGSTTTTTVRGQTVEIRHTFSEDALAALRTLTFQELPPDPGPWREWWASNRSKDWRTLLNEVVRDFTVKLPSAEPWVMNAWMSRLTEADDPAAEPFLNAYFRHPRLDINQTGPNSFSGAGRTPTSLLLLLNLASRGSSVARQLLYECSEKENYPLVMECPKALAAFDRPGAIARIRNIKSPILRFWKADTLVQLGDVQAIPMLIEELESEESAARTLAFRDLQHYTQEDIPYDPSASAPARKSAADAWRQWWRSVEGNFTLKTQAARVDLNCCRV